MHMFIICIYNIDIFLLLFWFHVYNEIFVYICIHIHTDNTQFKYRYIHTNIYSFIHSYDPREETPTPFIEKSPGGLPPAKQLIKIPNQLVNITHDLILFDKIPQHCLVHRLIIIKNINNLSVGESNFGHAGGHSMVPKYVSKWYTVMCICNLQVFMNIIMHTHHHYLTTWFSLAYK